jgi:hypothetical protein
MNFRGNRRIGQDDRLPLRVARKLFNDFARAVLGGL